MFGDIEGFTAWSSVREPSQVFILLESLYAAMDRIATKYRVFKVSTTVCGEADDFCYGWLAWLVANDIAFVAYIGRNRRGLLCGCLRVA